MVAKSAVFDLVVDGERTLRKEVCAAFAVDNRREDVDFTEMKADWSCIGANVLVSTSETMTSKVHPSATKSLARRNLDGASCRPHQIPHQTIIIAPSVH